MRRRSNIAGEEHRLSPRLFDKPLRLLRVLMLIQVRDENVRAFAGIGDGTDPLKTKFTELASKWTQLAVDLESALALTAQDVGPTHAHRHRAAHLK
jgi:hypothetical protein